MRYLCKVAYRDKVEPTTYLRDATFEELKKIVDDLLVKLCTDESVRGFYVAKSDSEE